MANMEDFIVKIKGNSEKLSKLEGIIRAASYKGGGDMKRFLEEYHIDVSDLEIDAD